MKKAVIFLAEGFEEIEALATADLLRRAGIETVLAGLDAGTVRGSHGVKVIPDTAASDILVRDYDAFICPGGPGAWKLKESERIRITIKDAFKEGKLIAAICAAPIVLEEAGILKGKKFTAYPSVKDEIKSGEYIEKSAVADGNVITGRGPGATPDFAFAIISRLTDEKTAEETRATALF